MAAPPSRINLHVSRTHFLLSTVENSEYIFSPRIPKAAQTVISDWGLALCPSIVVVATLDNKIIGFCRAREYKPGRTKMLCGCGTWVAKKYRRHGLATKLWSHLLSHMPEIKRVYVSTVSDAGTKLFQHLKQVRPHVLFDIY